MDKRKQPRKFYPYSGQMISFDVIMSLPEVKQNDLKRTTIQNRLKRGESVEMATGRPAKKHTKTDPSAGYTKQERDRIKKIMSVPVNPYKCRYYAVARSYEKKAEHEIQGNC